MFFDYPLQERVLTTLEKKGFRAPTPIQAETLPHTLAGKDILGQARTGTGKTLAFGLPIASRLEPLKDKQRAPRALVLTPTRELALQVSQELDWLAPHLQVTSIYGGTGYRQQELALKKGTDVVVATPGRAIDYMNRSILNLQSIEIAVLDEADEMLSMGFSEDIETLLSATPKERQTLLFSATLPRWAKKLARDYLIDPEHINVMDDEEVLYEELAIECNVQHRPGILSDLLHTHYADKTIIFTETKAETDELAKFLEENGHSAEAINGDLNQIQRERVMRRFRAGQVNALIGTNVAARGLDIPQVDLVIHYRLPKEAEAYQHRSGRTGRAGREGNVIMLYGPRERRELSNLERIVARTFKRSSPPSADQVKEAKLQTLLDKARNQNSKDKNTWHTVAQEIISKQDSDLLAGLFSHLLGGAPSPRSLLTGEEEWVTLELNEAMPNAGKVMRILKSSGIQEVGRILLATDSAYADVRPADADTHLSKLDGIRKAQQVPVVIEKTPQKRRTSHSSKKSPRRRSQNAPKAHY
ncbi:MAG: DEAD/DEAH box helicase [Trueperaceae bacterium]|nr:DEAD/DEAH box helicase [Trueperaceae bacterium]